MRRDYLIRDLYYNDAEMPVKEFHIERNKFVLRQVRGCTFACIVDRSWDTSDDAERSSKESYARLVTYLALGAISAYTHPRVELRGIPHDKNDDEPINELAIRGEANQKFHSSQMPDSFRFDKIMELMSAKDRARMEREAKQDYKRFLMRTRRLFKQYFPVVTKSQQLLTATEYCLRSLSFEKANYGLLIDSMICLEALFTNSYKDISKNIRRRGGILMMLGGFSREEASEQIKQFYEHRSSIVHGGKMAVADGWEIMEKLEELHNCVATSLKYFYILALNRSDARDTRQAVLSDLENCVSDAKLRTKLEQEIAAGRKDFDDVMFRRQRRKPVVDFDLPFQ